MEIMRNLPLVAIFVLSFLETSCSPEKPAPFPLLAELDHGKIYVPMFHGIPENPPQSVVFYPVFKSDQNTESDPSPLKGAFIESRTDISIGDFSDTRGFFMTKGLIYSSEKELSVEPRVGFIFPADRPLKFNKAKSEYRSSDGLRAYRVVTLTSGEGGHYFVQFFEKERCVMSADHYVYAGYDTVPDSNESFERANCGQVIHPEDLKIW